MFVIDTHVHIYPDWDLGQMLALLAERLEGVAPGVPAVACLTEGRDCYVYESLRQSRQVPGRAPESVIIKEDGLSLQVKGFRGLPPLFLLPGRQIVTKERLEILSIGRDVIVGDELTAEQAVGRVLELEGVPVLAWGAGKWLFKRAKVVEHLLSVFGSDVLLMGDSAMRPLGWPLPKPMRAAKRDGDRIVVAGSDPMPHESAGQWIGRYGSLVDGDFNPANPSESVVCSLRSADVRTIGSRPGVVKFWRRQCG